MALILITEISNRYIARWKGLFNAEFRKPGAERSTSYIKICNGNEIIIKLKKDYRILDIYIKLADPPA